MSTGGDTPKNLRLRYLGAELRRLRGQAGLSRDEVAERIHIDAATIFRAETARTRPQESTLIAMLTLYAVPEEQQGPLLELARKRRTESHWLQEYVGVLSPQYETYIRFEEDAVSAINCEGQFVPGLLQTEDYARATIERAGPGLLPGTIDALTRARISRQSVLRRDRPLQLWAIVDEGALRRPVGGPAVMAAQLGYLAGASQLPHVTLQVIPYSVGAHPGMAGSFSRLRFGPDAPGDVIYLESQAADLFLDGEENLARFAEIAEHLRALALPMDDSAALINTIARTMRA